MIKKLLPKSGFARNALTLFTGASIAQAVPILISPILTRLYPVHDFAILTLVTSLVTFCGVVITGRYEMAIMLPDSERDSKQVVFLATYITFFASAFLMIVFGFFHTPIADLLNNHDAAPYLLLVPLIAMMYGLTQAYTYWVLRKRRFATMASARVAQSFATSGVSLGMHYTGLPLNGLVWGNLAGQATQLGYTLFRIRTEKELHISLTEADRSEMKKVAAKYSDFPRINSLQALVDVLQSTGVIFLISSLYGSLITGLYGFTIRILQAPSNLIGSSIASVFYKEVSEKVNRNEKIAKLVKKTMGTLALTALPVFAILMIWGGDLFAFVFGATWREAGVYAGILSPWLYFNFIVSPVSQLPLVLNRQKEVFLISLLGNGLILLSIILGAVVFKDIRSGFIMVSCSQVVYLSGIIYYFIRISVKADRK